MKFKTLHNGITISIETILEDKKKWVAQKYFAQPILKL